jgi:hypothetical protein
MTEKLEFASDAWVDLAGSILQKAVDNAGEAIAGQKLSLCERFVDPPAHLRKNGTNEAAWSLRIDDRRVEVFKFGLDDADYTSWSDYSTTVPKARLILGTSPKEVEARVRARQEAVAAGRVKQQGTLGNISNAMRLVLTELHNELAVRTA